MKFLKPPPTRDSFASTKWKTIARFASHFPPIRCTILTVETLLEKGRKEVRHENEEREEERERGGRGGKTDSTRTRKSGSEHLDGTAQAEIKVRAFTNCGDDGCTR